MEARMEKGKTRSGCCGGREVRGDAEPEEREAKHAGASNAMEILKERFARGEIDMAEFVEKRQIISES
jgi:uncharacterized membrane protein